MTPIPLIVIHTDVNAMIEVNGQRIGECVKGGHIAIPVSDTGNCYILALPLSDDGGSRRYPIMRKISFEDGRMVQPSPGDIRVCKWHDDVYEIELNLGSLPAEVPALPYTIERVILPWRGARDTYVMTLYYENGLRLMLEEGDIVRCGFALGDGHGGNISFLDVGNARLVTVHASLNDRERLLVLNQGTTPILDISGDKASIEDSRPQIINALNTAVGHETRTRYEFNRDRFIELPAERGFFTHDYVRPADRRGIAIAFCEAAQQDFMEETFSYLTEDLRSSLTFDQIKDFVGNYIVRPSPVVEIGRTILGLMNQENGQLECASLLEFEFEDGLISDIQECEW